MARDDGGRSGRNSATCRYPACLPARASGVFAEKFELFRDGCLVLCRRGPLSAIAFLTVASPRRATARHSRCVIFRRPQECLFIHDLVIEQRARGKGAAGILSRSSSSALHGAKVCHISHSCRSTGPIPSGHGLVSRSCQTRLAEHLKSYGDAAHYMIRRARSDRSLSAAGRGNIPGDRASGYLRKPEWPPKPWLSGMRASAKSSALLKWVCIDPSREANSCCKAG